MVQQAMQKQQNQQAQGMLEPEESAWAAHIREQHGKGKQLGLTDNVKAIEDKWLLLPEYLRTKGLIKQHTESFNYLVDHGMRLIMEANAFVTR
jgi:DNA-directed RNA polymerase III subunit RPC2